ncbi:MAG: hypothetical protein L0323_00080 [Planctomycetes bacterium]|nr:hypothetical protein [Planctomycetota bacterium]
MGRGGREGARGTCPLLLLALAGCSSADRMLRIQPFSSASAARADRVNLWPLAYANGEEFALLWPLLDVDDRGFALRPLLAKDDTRWSILYPLASFDAASGEGWIGPLYDTGDHEGIFPVAGFDGLSYAGPLYWRKEDGEVESGGLFPIAHLSKGWSYVGTAFWSKDDSGEVERAGLFPLAAIAPGWGYAGPVWWGRGAGGEVDSWGVLPLFGTGPLQHAGPLWRMRDEEGRVTSYGLFPLLGADTYGKKVFVLPLYAHSISEEAATRVFLLGLAVFRRTPEGETDWILPLWFRAAREGAEDSVLFPLYYRRARDEGTRVFTLLGDRRVEGKESGLNVYPLWWSSEGPSGAFRMLVPLFYYKEEGTRRTVLTPLGGRGWDASGKTRFVNVLGPLFHRSESESGKDRTISFLWPLVEHERRGEEVSTKVVPFFGSSSSPGESGSWFAAGLGGLHSGETGSSWRLSPLASASSEEESPGFLYDWNLFRTRAFGGKRETRLFLLYEGRREPDLVEDTALLGFARRRRDALGTAWHVWPLATYASGDAEYDPLFGITLLGLRSSPRRSRIDVASPFLFSLDRATSGDDVSARVLAFFTYAARERGEVAVPTAEPDSDRNLLRSRRRAFLFGFAKDETREFCAWKEGAVTPEEIGILEPWSARLDDVPFPVEERDRERTRELLARHGIAVPAGGDPVVMDSVEEFVRRNTETRRKRHVRLPPLFRYVSEGEERSWSALLGLVGAETKKGRSRFSVLYSLYRTETEGGRTSRDLFPFLTWDTGPEEKRVSFLWRVFRYERVGGKTRGHVLFIPWGDD